MDQMRLLLAIGLSFLVFFLWNLFFTDQEAVQKQRSEKTAQTTQEALKSPYVPQSEQPGQSAEKVEPVAGQKPVLPTEASRIIQVATAAFNLRVSEKGALLKSVKLKKYRETIAEDSPFLEMISQEVNPGSVRLGFGDKNFPGWEDAVFTADIATDTVEVKDKPQKVSFTWVSPRGIVVEKIFTFFPDDYLIGLKINIKNGSDSALKEFLSLSLTKHLPENKNRFGFEGPSALIGNKLLQVEQGDIEEKNLYTGEIGWIAVQDRYFMSNIIPENPVETSVRLNINQNLLLQSEYIQPIGSISPGTQKEFDYRLFFGPKSLSLLKSYGYQLDEAIYFGWFDIIAKPCVWLMNFVYGFIPNYGIAIIIMTLLIKMILWPLGNKSYKSMAEMKKIQPLVAELKEKHKNDKKKINEETMKLYRTYKVNPLGGCLPMVMQIPVFFALYRMLYETIELRHAPFFGWITDLAAPDRLFNFGFSIPFMEPPYGIPVLTIVMGATMLLQQKMSPPPGDPAQAKMMMLMPIVFTVIFINFSSGLVLYWMVSNVISIAQQYYVGKKQA